VGKGFEAMKLRVVQIADRGVPNKERLHISVLANSNLAYYVVLATDHMTPTTVRSGALSAFWFREQQVRAGDNVILYTCAGVNRMSPRTDGGTDHFIFWGLTQTIWLEPTSCAVVLELLNWETSPS
jgi:hypothetical protein